MIFQNLKVKNRISPVKNNSTILHLIAICITVILYSDPTISLQVKKVTVPGYSAKGDFVEMDCRYELEGDQLYSVTWYKGSREFFRYVPGGNPKTQVFEVPGVQVDMTQSSSRSIVLKNVSRKSTGKYKCEVSAEAPSFHTDSGVGELLVADLPDNVPIISGLNKRYHVGDMVRINCTSSRSKPAAALSWYINGKKAEQSYLVEYAPVSDREGLETSTLGLKFLARPHHLRHGELKLRCTSTIASIYFKESSIRVKGHLTNRSGPFKEQITSTGGVPAALKYSTFLSCIVMAYSLLIIIR